MGEKTGIEEVEAKSLSRRGFLSGMALAGTGLAAASLLGGCSTSASAADVEWKEETDILVAGAGMSLFAALYGHMKGEKVLVVEKYTVLGGTASLSGGATWLPMNPLMAEPDNRDDVIKTIRKVAEGASTDELIEAYVDGSEAFSKWTVDELKFPWEKPAPVTIGWDRYQPVDGYRAGRALMPSNDLMTAMGDSLGTGMSGGPAMFKWLREKVDEVKLPYKLNTAVKKLVTNDKGEVIGVQVQEEGSEPYYIKAKKAVILATGGYDHDADMRKKYQRTPLFNTVAVKTNTGDGIKMGWELGADLAQMQSNWGAAAWLPVSEKVEPYTTFYNSFAIFDANVDRIKPGSIIVNKYGVRFANEGANYHTWNRTFEAWDAGADHFDQAWPGYLIVDADFTKNFALPLAKGQVGAVPKEAVQADTLEELASKLGIDWKNLSWQIDQFNKFAEQGFDPQFHRGQNDWDVISVSYLTAAAPRTGLVNPCLAPIKTPPFTAMTVYPGTLGTKGGLKTNGKAQVLRRDGGGVIPRLYASGGGANTPLGEGYPSMGGPLGTGGVMGYLAMVDAMKQTPVE